MKDPRGQLLDGRSPKRRRVVQQLRHHPPRVRIARVLDLNDAQLPALIHENEIGVPRRQAGLAANDDARTHAEVRKRYQVRVPRERVV